MCVAAAAAVHMRVDNHRCRINNTAYYIMHDRPWNFLLTVLYNACINCSLQCVTDDTPAVRVLNPFAPHCIQLYTSHACGTDVPFGIALYCAHRILPAFVAAPCTQKQVAAGGGVRARRRAKPTGDLCEECGRQIPLSQSIMFRPL